MTDFTDEQIKEFMLWLRPAMQAAGLSDNDFARVRDAFRPAPRFREGEVVAHEFFEDDQPTTEYVAFDAIGSWDGCRRLRLSEMPQAVGILRNGAGKARDIAKNIAKYARDSADQRHAQDIVALLNVDAFDREIEP